MAFVVNFWTATRVLVKVLCLLLVPVCNAVVSAEVVASTPDLAASIQNNGQYTSRGECLNTLKTIAKNRTNSFLNSYRELENEHKASGSAHAPSRDIGEIRINCSSDDVQLICNLISTETRKRPVDWEILNAAVESLIRCQSNSDIVGALEGILKLPLTPESNTNSQISAIETSLSILAQQNSSLSLGLLMQCALLPIDPAPTMLTASTELQGNPAELETLRRKVSHLTAIAVLEFVEKDSVLPFFEELSVVVGSDEKFKEEIAIHLEKAERIAAGDKDPSGIPKEEN